MEHEDSESLFTLPTVSFGFPQGINIGPEQNKVNMEQCAKLGVADKVRHCLSTLPRRNAIISGISTAWRGQLSEPVLFPAALQVTAVVGNINEKLPFEDKTFDACFSCEVHASDVNQCALLCLTLERFW